MLEFAREGGAKKKTLGKRERDNDWLVAARAGQRKENKATSGDADNIDDGTGGEREERGRKRKDTPRKREGEEKRKIFLPSRDERESDA